MKKTNCNTKDELITLLTNWLKTDEIKIGNGENQTGNTKWIQINLNGHRYYINADTTRQGVEVFVKNHEMNYPWIVIANNRKVYKKVSNDSTGEAIKGLYFYSVTVGKRDI